MKKLSLLALCALTAATAAAQYTVDPSNSVVIDKAPSNVDYIVLSDGAIAQFEAKGAKVEYVGPAAELGRNLWYWDQTFAAGDESTPRVDFEEGGYISVIVGNVGWSGAGEAVDAPGLDLSHFNSETRFHLAYMTPTGNGPASIAFILLDKSDKGSTPAKFSVGNPFNDNGVVYPAIGPAINDDWQAIDISLGDLKKLWPDFNMANLSAWDGNLFCWLGGGVQGQSMAFDAVYFYNLGESGVQGVAEDMPLVITGRTINASGAASIELYDLAGRKVRSAKGSVMGLEGLAMGVYAVKAGNRTAKVVVK